jgi:replicative DNA helicase
MLLLLVAGIGKTTSALSIALNIAFNDDIHIPIAIFSMEMSTIQLLFVLYLLNLMLKEKKFWKENLNKKIT